MNPQQPSRPEDRSTSPNSPSNSPLGSSHFFNEPSADDHSQLTQQQLNDPWGDAEQQPAFTSLPPKKSKKKILLVCGLMVLLLGGAAAYVFGLYLPNRPDQVWNVGLNRSGEALHSFAKSATEPAKLESFSRTNITGDLQVTNKDETSSGKLDATFDSKNAKATLEFSQKRSNEPAKTIGAKLLSTLRDGSLYPSIYFQLSGLKAFDEPMADLFMPGYKEYDGKWIAIDEEFLRERAPKAEQQMVESEAAKQKEEPIHAEDISEIIQVMTGIVDEYVLTTDAKKAILEKRSFVGKETLDGVQGYRYKVGINKDRVKSLCGVMIERILNTKIYKKAPGSLAGNPEALKQQKDEMTKQCQDESETIKAEHTFDLWIDAKYKLVSRIRLSDAKNKDTYTDIGQNYKGGDDISFFIHNHDAASQSDARFAVDTNIKTSSTKGSFTLKSTKEGSEGDLAMNFEAKPFKEEIKVERPAGAIPINDIFEQLSKNLDTQAVESDLRGTIIPSPIFIQN